VSSATFKREWHQAHRLGSKASADERIAWHQQHALHCRCRPVPAGVLKLMAARGIEPPADPAPQHHPQQSPRRTG
jgi:hypothetical protein